MRRINANEREQESNACFEALEAKATSVSENESEEEEWVSEDEGSDAGSVKAKPYFVSTLHHSKSAMRNSLSITRAPSLSVTFNTTATVR